MKKGYARVANVIEQSLEHQIEVLTGTGCEFIYAEEMPGSTTNRIELQRMLDELKEGDTIIVSDLSRISRSSRELIEIVERIKKSGATLQTLDGIIK